MIVQQFFIKGIAHSSYLLAGSRTCAIVDPRRDVQIYLDAARDLNRKITHILETHLHADFVSGHLDLAEITGATIYAPKSGECKFDHIALSEGDIFEIEDMELSVLETPGHTPEHICYVVADKSRGTEPAGVFCGDTLFVGDVGRPDLFPGRARELASSLYDSLYEKLLSLPDFCEVYPAHGAGSLCGRSMGAKRTTTIGYERQYNLALQFGDREEFIDSLTTDMPAAPDHFSRLSAINTDGPTLVRNLPDLEGLGPQEFSDRAENENTIVLDIRGYDSFGGQHIPGAHNIDLDSNFSTFAGWLLPPGKDTLLVAYDREKAAEATVQLRRVGHDQVVGYLDGSMLTWAMAGLPISHVHQLSTEELYNMGTGDHEMAIIDVRTPREYDNLHIEGAINIPLPDLRTRYEELDPDTTTALICGGGQRSSMGASILKQHGFRRVFNVAGGMTGYSAAGYATECPMCSLPHGSRFLGE
ncbi:rhodanese-like domain-containing protein [Candidatus Poribacteria bacterium]